MESKSDHIGDANKMGDMLRQLVDELSIVNDSEGVAGYHLNGDVLMWGQTEIPGLLEEAKILLADHSPDAGKVVYQCPRCSTSMEVDPAAKPTPAADGGEVEQLGKAYAYAVITQHGDIDYSVVVPDEAIDPEGAAKQLCRNHIEDAINDFQGAEKWEICPLYTHPAESREEIQAQALEEFASKLEIVAGPECGARVINTFNEAAGMATDEATRLRASQQEGGDDSE